MLLSLTENNEIVQGKFPGQHHRVKSNGYNLPLMKFFRMSKKRVDEFPHSIAFDICEQLLRAIETSDDFFFTDLARICKFEKSRPIISLEYWLTLLHWNYFSKGWKTKGQQNYFTAPELCELAFLRGFSHYDKLAAKQTRIPIRKMP